MEQGPGPAIAGYSVGPLFYTVYRAISHADMILTIAQEMSAAL